MTAVLHELHKCSSAFLMHVQESGGDEMMSFGNFAAGDVSHVLSQLRTLVLGTGYPLEAMFGTIHASVLSPPYGSTGVCVCVTGNGIKISNASCEGFLHRALHCLLPFAVCLAMHAWFQGTVSHQPALSHSIMTGFAVRLLPQFVAVAAVGCCLTRLMLPAGLLRCVACTLYASLCNQPGMLYLYSNKLVFQPSKVLEPNAAGTAAHGSLEGGPDVAQAAANAACPSTTQHRFEVASKVITIPMPAVTRVSPREGWFTSWVIVASTAQVQPLLLGGLEPQVAATLCNEVYQLAAATKTSHGCLSKT